MLDEELRAKPEQSLLDALMASRVGELEDIVEQGRRAGHEDAPFVEHEPVSDGPGITMRPGRHRVATGS